MERQSSKTTKPTSLYAVGRASRTILSRYGVVIVLLVLCVYLSLKSPYFLTASNLFNVARQVSLNAIMATGMTFVIISGGIDLSVGSTLALSSCLLAGMLRSGFSVPMAALAGLAIGAGVGVINGVLVSRAHIPPFIATLGMMNVLRGAAYLYTGGVPISGFPRSFVQLGQGYLGPVPMPVIICVVVMALGWFLLEKTKLGRYTFAIGGNSEASRLAGIDVDTWRTVVYGLCGTLAALTGIVMASRLNSAQPIAGIGYELDAIAATVIGGTSTFGGEGSMGGTALGAMIMGILRNGLNLLNVSPFLQEVVIGLVIIGAVLADTLRRTQGSDH